MSHSREYPARPICGVGVVVINQNSVLLVRRGQPPLYGEWSLPGGAVELGETTRQAAAREIREECGIEIAVGDVVEVVDAIVRDDRGRVQFHYVLIDFVAEYTSGALQATDDVLDAQWVAFADLDAYPLRPKTRRVIDKVLQTSSTTDN